MMLLLHRYFWHSAAGADNSSGKIIKKNEQKNDDLWTLPNVSEPLRAKKSNKYEKRKYISQMHNHYVHFLKIALVLGTYYM